MAKRKNNTLSNLDKATSKVKTKEEIVKFSPEEESTNKTSKPKVTRARTKSVEKITIIETNEENIASTSNVEDAIIIEESPNTNIVIDDMIDAVKDANHLQEVKEKKSQYKHPLLQEENTHNKNPYDNLAHLYATLVQDMAKFQQEFLSTTWKVFIEYSNQTIAQYYTMLNQFGKVKK
ncbi:MAG: hypothetical protein NZ455_09490 [Bacteroidia bacterium]|nr:hypothetical protein [Bacteroidia bacterium]MDW8348132.1 hypothetical protein [Bacteroidia bacterium]